MLNWSFTGRLKACPQTGQAFVTSGSQAVVTLIKRLRPYGFASPFRSKLSLFSQQIVQHLRHFCTGGGAGRVERSFAARDRPGLDQRSHGVRRPRGDAAAVREAGKCLTVCASRQLVEYLERVVQQREHLLAGDGVVGRKPVVAHAAGNAQLLRRREITGVVGVSRVREVVRRVRHRCHAICPQEHGDELAARQRRVGTESCRRRAGGDAPRREKGHGIGIPRLSTHIGEADLVVAHRIG